MNVEGRGHEMSMWMSTSMMMREKVLKCLAAAAAGPRDRGWDAQIEQIQAQLVLQNLRSDTTVASNFIAACSHSLRLLNSAALLFIFAAATRSPPHVFVCNSLIRAFSHARSPRPSLSIFAHMHANSIPPNNYTFPFVLSSLSQLRDLPQGLSVLAHAAKLGHSADVYVQNSLLSLCVACGHVALGRKVFDLMPHRDVVSWTTLISGSRRVGEHEDALIALERMQQAGVAPNRVTMVSALATCGNTGALEMGAWIHRFIARSGWELDVVLGTSLVDMYGKCGRVDEAMRVFQGMKERNVFTWNALIKGHSLAKSGHQAVQCFFAMQQQQEGIRPDHVTLLGVLSACAHSGLVETGWQIFRSLAAGTFGFPLAAKHVACMVHLLARAGHLQDALRVATQMGGPQPTESMWGALLSGARMHGDLELSELAARKLVELAPDNGAYYVMLSNLYAEMGKWDDSEAVRRAMIKRGIKKDLGSSFSMEVVQPEAESGVAGLNS